MKLKNGLLAALTITVLGLASCAKENTPAEASAKTAGAETMTAETTTASGFDLSDPELIARGKKLYLLCNACHEPTANKARKIGPHLGGLLNRKIASVESFSYSPALSKLDANWDQELLDEWLKNPQKIAPGNMMAFAGVNDDKSRAAIIAYISTL